MAIPQSLEGELRAYDAFSADVPEWLKQYESGVSYLADENEEVWNRVFDFGFTGKSVCEPLGLQEMREKGDGDLNLRIAESLNREAINPWVARITHLANLFGRNLKDPDVQTVYTASFVAAVRDGLKAAVSKIGVENTIVLAPDNGGRIMKVMLEELGFTMDQMPNFRMGRRQLQDGGYTVAVKFDQEWPKGENVLFADDCLARVGSLEVSRRLWAEKHGTPQMFGIAVGVGVRRSTVEYAKKLKEMGWNYGIWMAGESNSMNEHYYLALTKEEKKVLALPNEYDMRVGDMGNAMTLATTERCEEVPMYKGIFNHPEKDEMVARLVDGVIMSSQQERQTNLTMAAMYLRRMVF